ncbi:cuticle protein 7-like [Amphibalanus amphitrite]|uniref:cuticle protein 7-like n=1 Tax=Amphibalanus amphitrite TaxID=1232801 RepID=UPI001C9161BD|nr:cuticle protein 7-like [Amphibalanus amphitrite]
MKAFIVAALLAVAAADKLPAAYRAPVAYRAPAAYEAPAAYKEPEYEPAPYAFDYSVSDYETGSKFAANENSDGKQTSGYYTVALPGGRIQTVKYTVDDYAGYNAEVTYEGEAQYPEEPVYKAAPAPASVYKAAPVYKEPEQEPIYAYRPVQKYSN